ncbi:MAG: DUF5063 domain-containing protein, partial [Prevotellaceae bacterium]|nr:DUF5063 domain-containing protein [Prevotellaceae bacterium]
MQNQIVYAKNVLEFAAVAAESCTFFERAHSFERKDFVERLQKLLPLIYLKASMLPNTGTDFDDEPERFVTEDEYESVRLNIVQLLGQFDHYLEVMPNSEEVSALSIGEDIADIYQELKDFSENYQLGIEEAMLSGLAAVSSAFAEHWGQKLLNAL